MHGQGGQGRVFEAVKGVSDVKEEDAKNEEEDRGRVRKEEGKEQEDISIKVGNEEQGSIGSGRGWGRGGYHKI